MTELVNYSKPHVFVPAVDGMDLCKCGRFKSHEIHVGGDLVPDTQPEPELVGG